VSALRRFAALFVLVLLATTPTGCVFFGAQGGVCTTGVDTQGNPIKECALTADFVFSACTVCTTLTSDAIGQLPAWTVNCPGLFSTVNLPVCCATPSASVPVCFYYNDPLLVEMPNAWVPEGGSWKSDASPDSGNFLEIRANTMLTPNGGGPIVTDPGCTAWILWMDHTPADGNVHVRGLFRSPVADTGCVKAMEVSLEFWHGTPYVLIPVTTGQQFDFTQISSTGPQAVCVGPNTTVSDREKTWGQVKVHYR